MVIEGEGDYGSSHRVADASAIPFAQRNEKFICAKTFARAVVCAKGRLRKKTFAQKDGCAVRQLRNAFIARKNS